MRVKVGVVMLLLVGKVEYLLESGDLGEGRGEESTLSLTPLYLRAWGGLAYYLQVFVYKFLQIFFTLKYIHEMERTSISVHIFSIQMMTTT